MSELLLTYSNLLLLQRRANLANLQFRASRRTRSKDREDGSRNKRSILPRRRRKSSSGSEKHVHFSEKGPDSSGEHHKSSAYDDGLISSNDSRKTSFLTPDMSPNHDHKPKLSIDYADSRNSALVGSDKNSLMNNHMELQPVNSLDVKVMDRQVVYITADLKYFTILRSGWKPIYPHLILWSLF